MSDNMFRWEKDGDNVVTLTMDDPGGSANTLNDTFIHDLEKTLHRLEQEKDDIAGVVLSPGNVAITCGIGVSKPAFLTTSTMKPCCTPWWCARSAALTATPCCCSPSLPFR